MSILCLETPCTWCLGMGGFRTFFTTRVSNRSTNSEKKNTRSNRSNYIRGRVMEFI